VSAEELNKYANNDHKVPTVGKIRRKTNYLSQPKNNK
jgi:hypothetical protein